MKIHHNIIAASILGASLIIAVAIYSLTLKAGRYIYREKQEDLFLEQRVFDSATGTSYSSLTPHDSPTRWSVETIDDIKYAAQRQHKDLMDRIEKNRLAK